MPVINNNRFYQSVDELFSGRGGTPRTMEGEREYVRRFLVVVKMKEMNELSAATAPGIPRLGSIYLSGNGIEYDLLALARTISAKPQTQDDWQNWEVEVKYSTRMPRGGPNKEQDHPENEPADIKWGYEIQQEASLYDRRGISFLNSAGLPFSPPPTIERAFPVLSISRNELTFDSNRADQFCYSLNDKRFLGYPRGCAQSLPPEAEQKYRGKFAYWRVHYKIRFRLRTNEGNFVLVRDVLADPSESENFPSSENWRFMPVQDGKFGGEGAIIAKNNDNPLGLRGIQIDGSIDTWQPRYLDQGIMERVPNPNFGKDLPNGGKDNVRTFLRHCKGEDFKNVSHPVCLDGAGRQQKIKDAFGNIIAIYREYEVYRYADLTSLLVRGVGTPIGAKIPKGF